MNRRNIYFDGISICLEYEDDAIPELLDFLFGDLEQNDTLEASDTLQIIRDSRTNEWCLKHAGTSLFKGESLAGLGTILMGEAIFHLIRENYKGLAIHAGLVSSAEASILIPGNSGSGKSSVTTWLMCNGMRYHTDELVSISLSTRELNAFTRPLNIKPSGLDAVKSLFDYESVEERILTSRMSTMIPHRLLNPDFSHEIPALGYVLFPKFIADSKSELIRLSGAEAGLEMMRSNVIARNLPSHGFAQITKLVRDIPAFRLHYQHYDDLQDLLAGMYQGGF
jgi:hypothetical protein